MVVRGVVTAKEILADVKSYSFEKRTLTPLKKRSDRSKGIAAVLGNGMVVVSHGRNTEILPIGEYYLAKHIKPQYSHATIAVTENNVVELTYTTGYGITRKISPREFLSFRRQGYRGMTEPAFLK